MEFPYGLSDFGTLIGEGYFYQGRTDRIPQLEKAGRQLIFVRPRRFGKFIETRYFPVLSNRDYRWTNELLVKWWNRATATGSLPAPRENSGGAHSANRLKTLL